ncbi:MAG: helix-turn-helix domain-containing protein [Thermodesulfobacteriota bacterium]
MKRIIDQNYYELLEISPQASAQEVQYAYDQAMSIFSADSIAIYSLLSEADRELILARIMEAYKTLTNGNLREEYNQALLERGEILPEDLGHRSSQEFFGNAPLKEVEFGSLINNGKKESISPAEETFTLFNIDSMVTGTDIQDLRITQDISLDDVHAKTNIPKKTLQDIEEDRFEGLPELVYLKGFLKAYAKVLNVDEGKMTEGYLQRFLEWKNSSRR